MEINLTARKYTAMKKYVDYIYLSFHLPSNLKISVQRLSINLSIYQSSKIYEIGDLGRILELVISY